MENLSFHSNESTWATTINTIIYVEANVMNSIQSFSFIPLTASEEKIFFQNLPFVLPWQPVKFSDLDKIHMIRRGLLKKHFCKKQQQQKKKKKSMETISCHSNQSSYPIGKKQKQY